MKYVILPFIMTIFDKFIFKIYEYFLLSREEVDKFTSVCMYIKGQSGALKLSLYTMSEEGPTTRVYHTQPYLAFILEAVSKA